MRMTHVHMTHVRMTHTHDTCTHGTHDITHAHMMHTHMMNEHMTRVLMMHVHIMHGSGGRSPEGRQRGPPGSRRDSQGSESVHVVMLHRKVWVSVCRCGEGASRSDESAGFPETVLEDRSLRGRQAGPREGTGRCAVLMDDADG